MTKVIPGQLLDGLPARSWNRHEDAAAVLLDRGGIGGSPPRFRPAQVLIKNSSGSDLDFGGVLGVDGLVDTFADALSQNKVSPVLDGASPVLADHTGKFAIATDDIANGSIGPAIVSGMAVARLDNPGSPPPHPFADVAASTATLVSSWYGAARILVAEVTGGQRWAVVVIGNWSAPTYLGKVTETGGISSGGSGDVDILIGGTAEETVTAYLDHAEGTQSAAQNAEVFVEYLLTEQRWQIKTLDCEAT